MQQALGAWRAGAEASQSKRAALAHAQQRALHATLTEWALWAAERAHHRLQLQVAAARWAQACQAAVFARWADWAAAQRHKRHMVKYLHYCHKFWSYAAFRNCALRMQVQHALRQGRRRALRDAFLLWRALVRGRDQFWADAELAAAVQLHRAQSGAFLAWRHVAQARAAVRQEVQAILARMRQQVPYQATCMLPLA